MFSPIIMPDEAYMELHENLDMPLPLPKPSSIEGRPDLNCMSLEEAVKHPSIDKHQSSLINRRFINNVMNGEVSIVERESMSSESDTQNKITQGKYIREVISCKGCMKPRCLYSFISPNRMKPSHVDGATEPNLNAIILCRDCAIHQFESAYL